MTAQMVLDAIGFLLLALGLFILPVLLYRCHEADLFWSVVIALFAWPGAVACVGLAWASLIDWSK